MANYQYSNEIAFGRTEPVIGNYESVYSVSFASGFPNGESSAYQGLSAIKLLQRFADVVALSGATNGAAISAAVNGLDGLGYASNS